MLNRTLQILCITAMVIVTSVALAANPGNGKGKKNKHGESRQTRSENGNYSISSVGTFKGQGAATIGEDGVSFTIDVSTIDGSKGQMIASKLAVDGPYFSGNATAMGRTIAISGRLDAAKASRLNASYVGNTGDAGRITGTLPEDAGDTDWDEPPGKAKKDKDDKKDKD